MNQENIIPGLYYTGYLDKTHAKYKLFYFEKKQTWHKAERFCRSLFLTLPILYDANDARALSAFQFLGFIFIGLRTKVSCGSDFWVRSNLHNASLMSTKKLRPKEKSITGNLRLQVPNRAGTSSTQQ